MEWADYCHGNFGRLFRHPSMVDGRRPNEEPKNKKQDIPDESGHGYDFNNLIYVYVAFFCR